MERLRQKGYLTRSKAESGVYRYAPKVSPGEVMKGLVRDFIRKTLGGTVTPFVAYLNEADDLTAEEQEALRRFVETLPDTKDNDTRK
jgi:predicted transcriptional regulator